MVATTLCGGPLDGTEVVVDDPPPAKMDMPLPRRLGQTTDDHATYELDLDSGLYRYSR